MKKVYKIMILAIIVIAGIKTSYAQFPCWSYTHDTINDTYTWEGVNWGMISSEWKTNNYVAPGKQALTFYKHNSFNPANGIGEAWDLVPSADARPLNKYVSTSNDDGPTSRVPASAADFTAEIKGLYDNTNIYVLVKVTDDDIMDGSEVFELFWASYKDFLAKEDWPFTPKCTQDDEHVIAIWGNRGAGKGLAKLTEDTVIVAGFDAWLFDPETGEQTWAAPSAEELGVKVYFEITSNTTYEAIVEMNIDKFFGGFIEGVEDEEFSFEFRVVDVDEDHTGVDVKAQFSTVSNNVWWSTYDMGHGMFGPDLAVNVSDLEEVKLLAYPNPASGVIYLNKEVVSAKLINIAGKIVYEGNSLEIEVDGFTRGIYFLQMVGHDKTQVNQKIVLW